MEPSKKSPEYLTGAVSYKTRPDEGCLDIQSIHLSISKEDLALSHTSRKNHLYFFVDGTQYPTLA